MDPKLVQAAQHHAAGRYAQAKSLLQSILQRDPDSFDALGLLCDCCAHLGEFPQAEFFAGKALKLRPSDHFVWMFLGKIAIAAHELDKAEAASRKAAELAPRNPDAWRALAWVLQERNEFAAAREAAQRGIALAPADEDLRLKEGNAVRAAGRSAEAFAVFQRAIQACPSSQLLAVGRAYASNFVRGLDPAEVLSAHRHAGALIAAAAKAHAPLRPRSSRSWRLGQRPLRVGLVSPDLRRHSVAYFVRPLLQHHDRARLRVFCYSVGAVPDEVTAQLRAWVGPGDWRDIPRRPAARPLAEQIAADDLDVLIELSGHTGGSSLDALAHRPAPIQITHIGYPATTGLDAIDFRIVDALTDPPGVGDAACCERLIRLDPCFTCYSPPDEAPPIRPRGRSKAPGGVVFGSFNMLPKLNDDLFALWARVIAGSPGSRLLVKCRGLEHEAVRRDVRARMVAAGLPPAEDRVQLIGPRADPADHLSTYDQIDVALDTSPYCGTTTTCEALLMGVPVVTLAADLPWHPPVHVGRVGLSLLKAGGFPELVAFSPDDYVQRAIDLAGDPGRLETYRTSLRGRLLESPLTDARAYVLRLTAALEQAAGTD